MGFDINLDCQIWIDDIANHLTDGELTISKINELRALQQKDLTPESICDHAGLSLEYIESKLGVNISETEELESLASIQSKVDSFQQELKLFKASLPTTDHQQLDKLLLKFGSLNYEIGIHNTAAQTNHAMTYGEKAKMDVTKGGVAVSEKNNQYREIAIKIAQDFFQQPEHQTVKYAFVARAIKQLIRDHKKVSVSEGLIKKQIFEYVPAQAKAGGRPDKEVPCKDIVQELILRKYSKLFG
ncbi:hypothetical protein [Shewanella colwelliana]|uniref:hypothetical protein n=1 Tax=Shewanella colwelliana TaxID=23 RepID=UPI000490C3FE|nr:hypothetical protein [Shewanella colwelliana]